MNKNKQNTFTQRVRSDWIKLFVVCSIDTYHLHSHTAIMERVAVAMQLSSSPVFNLSQKKES